MRQGRWASAAHVCRGPKRPAAVCGWTAVPATWHRVSRPSAWRGGTACVCRRAGTLLPVMHGTAGRGRWLPVATPGHIKIIVLAAGGLLGGASAAAQLGLFFYYLFA